MNRHAAIWLTVILAVGCHWFKRPIDTRPTNTSEYHAEKFDWDKVRRVVVLPASNESKYNRAGTELSAALSAELQQAGRFEVVAPPAGFQDRLAQCTHRTGRFDEAVMLDIGRATRADVIIHPSITQYSPYPRPRLGLVLHVVSPRDGLVVSSVDGLWDSTQLSVENRAKLYYRQLPGKPPWIGEHRIAAEDGHADELALESPYLFQRFVCHEAVERLLGPPAGVAPVSASGYTTPPAVPPAPP